MYFPVQLTTCRVGSLTRLIHTLAICVTIHTHIIVQRVRYSITAWSSSSPKTTFSGSVARKAGQGGVRRGTCLFVLSSFLGPLVHAVQGFHLLFEFTLA